MFNYDIVLKLGRFKQGLLIGSPAESIAGLCFSESNRGRETYHYRCFIFLNGSHALFEDVTRPPRRLNAHEVVGPRVGRPTCSRIKHEWKSLGVAILVFTRLRDWYRLRSHRGAPERTYNNSSHDVSVLDCSRFETIFLAEYFARTSTAGHCARPLRACRRRQWRREVDSHLPRLSRFPRERRLSLLSKKME